MFADPRDLHTAISRSTAAAAAHHCNYALGNSQADDLTSKNRQIKEENAMGKIRGLFLNV